MYCMFLFNSLIVGFYYVVRYSVFIYGDLFFGLFIIICGIYIIFCVMDIRLFGLFCIYGSLYGIDLLFMGSMKVNRKKGLCWLVVFFVKL